MATIHYEGDPFDQYLRDAGVEEDALPMPELDRQSDFNCLGGELDQGWEGGHGDGDDDDEDRRADQGERTPSDRPSTPPSSSRPAPSPSAARFAEVFKYTLATSSLLNARLADAIPLYPASTALFPPPAPPTAANEDQTQEPSNARSTQLSSLDSPLTKASATASIPLAWGDGWEKKGLSWDERSFGANLGLIVSSLVAFVLWVVARFSSTPSSPSLASTPTQPSVMKPTIETVPARLPEQGKPEHSEVQDATMVSVNGLISASQSLDLRVSRALTGIREVECISWGLGLSSPLPPISRLEGAAAAPRARLSSPIGFASPISHAHSHSRGSSTSSITSNSHFQPFSSHSRSQSLQLSSSQQQQLNVRAKPLRAALSRTLEDTTAALNDARVAMKQLLPSTEVEEAEVPGLTEWKEKEGEEQEVEWDSFGGVLRRKTSMRRAEGGAGGQSLNSTPRRGRRTATPLTTGDLPPPRDSTPPPPTPEQRTTARFGSSLLATAVLPSSPSPRAPTPSESSQLGLSELQASFENLHAVRRGLLWKLLVMIDRVPPLSESIWRKAASILDGLAACVVAAEKTVTAAVEVEFGADGIGSQSLDVPRPRPGSRHPALGAFNDTSANSSPLAATRQGRPRPASWHRESLSTGFLRELGNPSLSASVPASATPPPQSRTRPLSLSFASNYSVYSTPTTPRRGPSATAPPMALALSSSSSNSTPTPNFAPANPYSSIDAAEADLESQIADMGLALRSIAAKLHVVRSDASSVNGLTSSTSVPTATTGPATVVDRILATHDSIRFELENLQRAWDHSRLSLRALLKPSPPSGQGRRMSPSEVSEEDDVDESVGSTSLDSIPDEEDEESVFESEIATPSEASPLRRGGTGEKRYSGTKSSEDTHRDFVIPPSERHEQVFEAIVPSAPARSTGPKLSREERIKAVQEMRKERRLSAASGTIGGGGGGVRLEAGMVAELKDVLDLLKGRSRLPPDV